MDLGTSGTNGQMHQDALFSSTLRESLPVSASAVASSVNSLETVRALHQTIVSLRSALEQSRAELHSLRLQFQSKVDPAIYTSTIEKLSLENHILRQKVISSSHGNLNSLFSLDISPRTFVNSSTSMDPDAKDKTDESSQILPNGEDEENKNVGDDRGNIVDDEVAENDIVIGETDEDVERRINDEGDRSISSADTSTPKITKGESEESEELDDIELIFTTEDTKELSELQEDLVSIADTESWQKGSQEKCDRLKKMWATHSVLVETDISKCGVVDENDPVVIDQGRRYTLPNPAPYRPIIHREALTGSKSQLLEGAPGSPRPVAVKFSQNSTRSPKTTRPILVENNTTKQESEAQTDITALPAHWRSESYLAHKVSHNFTTLPSKFALPVQSPVQPPRKQSLKLCEKTQEARRVLLSDINFTSMVPELSRSADHLCNEAINASVLCKNYPRAFSYMKNPDSVMSPGYLSRVPWSPCDCSHRQSSWECYHSSAASMHSPSAIDLVDGTRRRHSMRPSTSSTDTYWGSVTSRPNWSVPSSPTYCRRSRSIPLNRTDSSFTYGRPDSYHSRRSDSRFLTSTCRMNSATARTKNRVTFKDSVIRSPGQSLPDLRLTADFDSGEDSTESLIDESEEFLRRSIDSMMKGNDWVGGTGSRTSHSRRTRHHQFNTRRHSDPDPVKEFEPPKAALPFLAKVPRDLKLNYLVKVISEGRVIVGRVRYIGPVSGHTDYYVGVKLPHGEGNSDGTFEGKRYFDCEPDCAIFVPFKKVVMAWNA